MLVYRELGEGIASWPQEVSISTRYLPSPQFARNPFIREEKTSLTAHLPGLGLIIMGPLGSALNECNDIFTEV